MRLMYFLMSGVAHRAITTEYVMKKIFLTLITIIPALGFAQQDAKSILEKFSAQMQKAKNVAISFEYVYENSTDQAKEREKGELLVKDNMYRLDWDASTIYFNGEVRWTYIKSANEVTITLPNPIEDGIFANPSALFSINEKDYKYKMRGEKALDGKPIVEVDLFPKDNKADYTNINLRLDKATLQPLSIIYYDKSGGSVYIAVKRFDTSVKTTLTDFTFDIKKHPNVEVVDMR